VTTRDEIAFPNSQHTPVRFPERSVNQPITRNIPMEFRQPEFDPTFRRVAKFAVRMPMPETAVDEHDEAMLWKDKVWLAEQFRIPPPAR
jgi:hypothetical protein